MAHAEAASEAADWVEAVQRWQALLGEFTDAPPSAYARLSRAHRALRDFVAAEAVVERGRLRYPEVGLAIEHAEIVMGRRDWVEAVRCWQGLLDEFGDEVPEGVHGRLRRARERLAIERAEVAMGREDWAEAVRRWQVVLGEFGEAASAGVYGRLSRAYRGLGDFETAEVVVERGRQVHRDVEGLAVEWAEIAMGREDWAEAVRRWQVVLGAFGEAASAGVYGRLSRAHRALGDHDAAEGVAGEGRARHPGIEGLAVEWAELAMGREDWAEAVRRWRAVLDEFAERAPTRAFGQLHVALRWQGDHEAADAVFEEYLAHKEGTDYEEWVARNDTLSDRDRSFIRNHIASLPDEPKVSLLMSVHETTNDELAQTIDSVRGQLYENWELCVVDDASASNGIRATLEGFARHDPRIRLTFRPQRGGASICADTALTMASGDWVVPIDAGDTLAEHALYLVAEASNKSPDATIIYGDEDSTDATGRRFQPHFKPDWDYDLFLSHNLLEHSVAYRADLAHQVNGFRHELDGWHDWDLALRIVEAAPDGEVHHIPIILYHRRTTSGGPSSALSGSALEIALRVVNEHLDRTEQPAAAMLDEAGRLRIKRTLPSERPLVSIIIPAKDRSELLRTSIDGVINRTDYEPIEIVVVDNGSSEPDACALLDDLRSRSDVTVVDEPGSFNFSKLVNVGVAASSGEVTILLNNDIDVINDGWLEELVSHAIHPGVGAVGAKLYYANETVQHGGVVLGLGTVAGHAHRHFPRSAPGYANRLRVVHALSAVTAACLATRRDIYDKMGGFNERDLPVAFNDVDFCLRVREAGYKVIWTPHAELYHFESVSRRKDTTSERIARAKAERAYMRQQWGPILDNDPFYSPNLDLGSEAFSRADVPRVRRPWLEAHGD